ncbi:30S ribosomal protein S2 [bacterium]|nr:30S ribosomal protein S2 [bacterium]
MLEAGVHFGHERSKRNPKMEPYVFLRRNRVAIIDLEKTQEGLIAAATFVERLMAKTTGEVLFVGTKRQAREIVRRHAESVKMPYVTKRWLGGTLTNFATIQKSIEKLDELKKQQESSSIEKLTKKERAVMRKEIGRLEEVLEGMMNVRKLPAALFVVGAQDEKLAVREARRAGIPIIGIADTNANPDLLDYAIPANDDAVRSLDMLVDVIAQAIAAGLKHRPKEPTPEVAEKK